MNYDIIYGLRIEMLSQRERQIARRVRQAREEAHLSQEAVARELSLTKAGFGHYEREVQPFGVEMLFRLAPILGKPVSYFLGLDTGNTPDEDELLAAYRATQDSLKEYVLGLVKTSAKVGK